MNFTITANDVHIYFKEPLTPAYYSSNCYFPQNFINIAIFVDKHYCFLEMMSDQYFKSYDSYSCHS